MCLCPRFMRGLLMNRRHASFLRASTGGGRLRWRPGFSLLKRSRWKRKRKRKRWRSRGSFLTSVLVVGAGMCMPAASALVDGTAHLHTMSLSFIQTHGSALCLRLVWPGFKGLASLGPFLGAPAGSPGQVKYTGGTGASPDPFLGASTWCVSITDHGSCGGGSTCAWRRNDRGMPVPQILSVRGGGQVVWRTSTGAVLGQGC